MKPSQDDDNTESGETYDIQKESQRRKRLKIPLAIALLLLTITTAYAIVNWNFPATLKIHTVEQLILTGPTPTTATIYTGSKATFTLTVQDNAGPLTAYLWFTSNTTDWTDTTHSVTGNHAMYFNATQTGYYNGPNCYPTQCWAQLNFKTGQNNINATITTTTTVPLNDYNINFGLSQ